MKKTLVLLMIVSTIIGMIVPAMATDTDKAKADADAVGTATSDATAANTAGDVTGMAKSMPTVTTSADANGGSNQKTIDVDVTGYNSADNKIKQVLDNTGDQSNYAKGIAVGGNAQAISWAAPDNDQNTDSSATNHGHVTSGSNTNDCPAKNSDSTAAGGDANHSTAGALAASIQANVPICTNNGGAANNDQDSTSNAANVANNPATSNAIAVGGSPEGIDGDVTQLNAIVQVATAHIDNDQDLDQTVTVDDTQNANGGTATDNTGVTSTATTNPFSEAFSNPITSDADSDTTADADATAV